jgi:hypothetical protein
MSQLMRIGSMAAIALVVSATAPTVSAQMTILEVARSITATADRVDGDGMSDTDTASGPNDNTLWVATVSASDEQVFNMSVLSDATTSAQQTSSTSASNAVVNGYLDAQATDWSFDGFNPGGGLAGSSSSYVMRFSVAAMEDWTLAGGLTLDNRGTGAPSVNQSTVTVSLTDAVGTPIFTETLCGASPCASDTSVQINASGSLAAGEYILSVTAVANQGAYVGPSATPTIGQRVSYSAVLAVGVGGAPPASCLGDFDMSGAVDGADLAALLAGWGACP